MFVLVLFFIFHVLFCVSGPKTKLVIHFSLHHFLHLLLQLYQQQHLLLQSLHITHPLLVWLLPVLIIIVTKNIVFACYSSSRFFILCFNCISWFSWFYS